jgi:hypothetical protein
VKNFIKNGIVFGDISLKNIVLQKNSSNSLKFIAIDGIGSRRSKIKLFFYVHSIIYSKYKIFKQFKILFKQIKRSQSLS